MIINISLPILHAFLSAMAGLICFLLGVKALKSPSSKFSPPVGRAFFLLTTLASIWLIGFSLGAISENSPDARFWEMKVGYLGVVAIGPSLLLFTLAFLGQLRQYYPWIIFDFLLGLFFYFLIYYDPNFILIETSVLFFGRYPEYGSHFIYFLTWLAANLGLSLYLLAHAYYSNTNFRDRNTFRYLLTGFLVSYGAAVDFLPGYGAKNVYAGGYIPILLFSIVLFIALMKYRFMDIEHQLEKSEQRLSYVSQFDLLTNIPNRFLFQDRLDHTIALSDKYHSVSAVLILDLDQFKLVNESLGHGAGDKLLQSIARRLSSCIREGDTLARIGGDEFAVILHDIERAENAGTVAGKFLDVLSKPIRIAGHDIYVTLSIGIALYPFDHRAPNTLLKCAEIALHLAKEEGRNIFKFYTTDMNIRAHQRLSIENRLRGALEGNELSIHYQPQVNIGSGKITGAEALLRWSNPVLGSISPSRFIPVAEETGLILPIGEWVIETVCAQINDWRKKGVRPFMVSVNLSGRQLKQPNFTNKVARILRDNDLPPDSIEFELTESSLIDDTESAIRILEEFRKMGIRIAIDDFGTGYSSLSYLKRLPINTLKIDQSFIRNIHENKSDSAITSAIIALAHSLDLTVIAEWVESRDQFRFLRENRCDSIQGNFFSLPLPSDEFILNINETLSLS